MKPKLRYCLPLASFIAVLLASPAAHAASLYWDGNSTTIGAGTAPAGTWGSSNFWNTDMTGGSSGALQTTTLTTDDLFFAAGADAKDGYTISLTTTQNAKSLHFEEGNVTLSGTDGKIVLGGTGLVRVNGGLTAKIGNSTTTVIDGTAGLTKNGVGTLIISNTASNTITGGFFLNGGTLAIERNGTPFSTSNALTFAGGTLVMKAVNLSGTTLDQNFGNVTVNAGGGTLQVNRNGLVRSQVNLGAITATAAGGSLLLSSTSGTQTSGIITTTSANDATGILGGRIIYSDGTAGTGMNFATITTGTTVGAYAGYTAMLLTGGSSTTNYSTSAGGALSGALAVNALKVVGSATALALTSNTLTIASGGLLSTGAAAQTISGTTGRLTAGDGLGGTADLVIHQYNTAGLTVSAAIGDNAAGSGNTVNLVKAGTGYLALSGTNTYTGNTYVNGGVLDFKTTTPAGAGANIFVIPGASVKFDVPTQTLLNRIAATTEEFGVMTFSNVANALDFTNHPNAFLAGGFFTNGAKTDNFTGTITPANNTYRLGYTGAAGGFGLSTLLGGANDLIIGGNNVILTNANTFSGETVIRTGANLLLANTLALQNSVLNVGTGSDTVTGLFALSRLQQNIINDQLVSSATFGGLSGSRNLATAYGGAYGNNAGLLSSIAVRGFTLNPGSEKSLTHTGVIANFARDTTITKSGAGTQELGGNNTYSGVTTISDGVLKVNHAAALGKGGSAGNSAGSTIVNSGGSLALNGLITLIEPIVLNGTGFGGNGALVNNSGTEASIVGGIASIQITGGGTYLGTAPTVSLTGTGTGATATVQLGLSSASLSSFSGGAGWVVGDLFTTSGGAGTGAVFEVTAVTSGNPTAWTVVNAGSGYTTAPTGITKLSRTGTLTGTLTLSFNATNNVIGGLTLTNGGSGYDDTTTASFSAGSATATVQHSSVVLASDSSIGGSGNLTIGAVVSQIGGSRSLTKVGAGTLTFSGVNTYSGDTTITGGTLALSGAATIASSSRIQINSTTALSVAGIAGTTFSVGATQTLAGNGTVLATGKTVNVSGTLSPGASPGTLTQDGGSLQLAVGGDYNWQIVNATGFAGAAYDTSNLINSATLDLSLLSANNTYNINLWSLSGTGPDVNGNAINFDNALSQSWVLFSTTVPISGFSTEKFTINSAPFNGTSGFSNALNGGAFSVALADSDTDMVLIFTAVPEPNVAVLIASLGGILLLRRRR